MYKNTKIILFGLILLAVAVSVTNYVLTKNSNLQLNNSPDTTTQLKSEKDKIEQSIVSYLEEKNKESYYSSSGGKLFCAANIVWQDDGTNGEKIIYAKNECSVVRVVNGDLRSQGGGDHSLLFKVKKIENSWKIIDADTRTVSPTEPITQEWVRKAEKQVSENNKTRCFDTNCFSTKGVIDKAAEFFQIQVPKYLLNACKKNSDCNNDSICVLSGVHSNPGPNTCVKKCTANKDCGIAHTCRGQCVMGENGCPETAQNICIPDLLYYDLEKDPNGIIQ